MDFKYLLEVGTGFFNIRGSFSFMLGLVDIGTQMSVIHLPHSNKFLVIDTIPLTPEIKEELDVLTNNGKDIEAVLATHPFHTLSMLPFFKEYPKASYYGTPRHIRNIPDIPWVGILEECKIRAKWNPDIEMKIPNGAEFADPKPEKNNHFSCVFVFHKPSKTLHVDDTLMYCPDPSFLLKIGGFKKDGLSFHPSIKGPGLLPHPNAPFEFRDFIKEVIHDWDFDNICAAHMGNKIGGAHEQLEKTLKDAEPLFQKLHEKRLKGDYKADDKGPDMNVKGCECG